MAIVRRSVLWLGIIAALVGLAAWGYYEISKQNNAYRKYWILVADQKYDEPIVKVVFDGQQQVVSLQTKKAIEQFVSLMKRSQQRKWNDSYVLDTSRTYRCVIEWSDGTLLPITTHIGQNAMMLVANRHMIDDSHIERYVAYGQLDEPMSRCIDVLMNPQWKGKVEVQF